MDRQYVLASGNRGKLREVNGVLKPLGFIAHPQSDWKVPEAAETAGTFVENSLIKARQAARYTGLPSIADDSGLVVPALNGQPGIYSARYAGEDADDQANIEKLLAELAAKKGSERHAFFYCAVVLVLSVDDQVPLIATGQWHGQILDSPRGSGGFGYDPVFGISTPAYPGRRASAAELTATEKSLVSHRGLALRDLVRQLQCTRVDGRVAE